MTDNLGTADLELDAQGKLIGSYFNDRPRSGSLVLQRVLTASLKRQKADGSGSQPTFIPPWPGHMRVSRGRSHRLHEIAPHSSARRTRAIAKADIEEFVRGYAESIWLGTTRALGESVVLLDRGGEYKPRSGRGILPTATLTEAA